MFTVTTLTCPMCGNSWSFIHTYKEEPILGYCERCDKHFDTGGVYPNNMMEHRRPKTLFWYRQVSVAERGISLSRAEP